MSIFYTRPRATTTVLGIFAHSMAIAVVAGLLGSLMVDRALLVLIVESIRAGVFAGRTLMGCAAHLGLSALIWGFVCLIFRRVSGLRAAPSRRVFVLSGGPGTVFVETLIALPVALLLIFGLAQLALNNVAGVMANAATFEATRAAWLWMPEAHSGRMGGITREQAEEKARIQATLVLMTVAPGEYKFNALLSPSAEQARGMVVGSQIPFPGSNSGAYGLALAEHYTHEHVSVETSSSFARALDSSRLIKRSARKFDAAYATTRVHISEFVENDKDMLRVKLVYRHACVMPLVAPIFGKLGTAEHVQEDGAHGYFLEIIRVFERRRLAPPSRHWPQGTTISPIPFL